MKLGHTEQKLLAKGDEIRTRAGRRYVIETVRGSTVTCRRVPTTLERIARTLGLAAGVVRSAYRNARGSARIARAKQEHARRSSSSGL